MKRVAIIGIIIKGERSQAQIVNQILSDYADIIIGRMGVPDRTNNIYAISIVVEGSNEEISALTGKLGRIENVNVKTAMTAVEI